ncbi:MAG: sugar phosphate isomerase/epimerase [Candidatus Latescibacterota bacterium]|jgi:sugar phosphate isomerase/epimerase
MRIGGPIYQKYSNPTEWVAAVHDKNYRAAFCPVGLDAEASEIAAYAQAALDADILIAEVGAWSNPLSPDPEVREAALEKCRKSLALAEAIGARCCVNISGSRGAKWDGPHAEDISEETFALIVETIQNIIDAVEPKKTHYTLEAMPWMYPDSPQSYLRLFQEINREANAVHLDPVNLINSPRRYFNNADLIRDCFAQLGPHIRSCHAKDILLQGQLTVHLDEVRPGLGALDYRTFLRELDQLDVDTPLMLEHLPNEGEYDAAAAYIRAIADELGCSL